MTGHALFIWLSYALALVAFGGLTAVSVAAHRKARRDVAARGLDRGLDRGLERDR
mgnify:CR=1 FL=1